MAAVLGWLVLDTATRADFGKSLRPVLWHVLNKWAAFLFKVDRQQSTLPSCFFAVDFLLGGNRFVVV